MTPDEQRDAAARVAAFTAGNDPNPGGRFPSGSYRTPDESREQGQPWVSRPGEPQDVRDPYHYQSPDEARAIGIDWNMQPSFTSGRERRSAHPAYATPDERSLSSLLLPGSRGQGSPSSALDLQSVFGSLFSAPVSSTMPVDRRLASLLSY